MLCTPCKNKTARYNAARYAGDPKPWPSKRLCRKCKAALRPHWLVWRKAYSDRHPGRVGEAQRKYRARLKKAS